MRNTKIFDLNVLPGGEWRKLGRETWQIVCNQYNDRLVNFFKSVIRANEFSRGDPGMFTEGKYWQMLDYLDGNYLLRNGGLSSSRQRAERKAWQDELLIEGMPQDDEVLQAGWDIAINSALLCDMMPTPRNHGAAYLLEHVIWDQDSLFYPSLTDEFVTRTVNDAFWQIAVNVNSYPSNKSVLEQIMTRDSYRLNPGLAAEQIKRWGKNSPIGIVAGPLVSGDAGRESFSGLSPRAVENYGRFMAAAASKKRNQDVSFAPFKRAYKEAVKCEDEDGISYFSGSERKRLLSI